MLIILLFQLRKLSQGIALHDAVKKNQTDIVLDLISNGVEIDGHSLNIAISSNNTNMVDLLVTHGADAKYIDKNQQLSMIHIACMLNNIKAVDILISHGANVNDQNSLYRYSPLIFASMFNYKEIAELLISHGANVNLGDFRGNTPIHHILFFGDETIMEAIVNSYSQIFNEDFINSFDIHKKNNDLIELLLSNGADVNKPFHDGNTPLHLAIAMSSFEIIEILISHGAKIYELNKKGQTPLDIAFMREKAKHAEYIELRDAGDDNHLQFLDWQDANKIVNLLMSKGAKTNSDGEL